jgi:hypothetical protein
MITQHGETPGRRGDRRESFDDSINVSRPYGYEVASEKQDVRRLRCQRRCRSIENSIGCHRTSVKVTRECYAQGSGRPQRTSGIQAELLDCNSSAGPQPLG